MRNTKSSKKDLERKIVAVLLALCLMPLLSACGTTQVVTRTEVQRVPAALLSPCPKSYLPSGKPTYSDAIKLAEKRGLELDECNKRLEDIRSWSDGSPNP